MVSNQPVATSFAEFGESCQEQLNGKLSASDRKAKMLEASCSCTIILVDLGGGEMGKTNFLLFGRLSGAKLCCCAINE